MTDDYLRSNNHAHQHITPRCIKDPHRGVRPARCSVIPLEAAEHIHRMVREERGQAAGGAYTPKFFPEHAYQTLRSLCQTIIPPDEKAGGALEAGARSSSTC